MGATTGIQQSRRRYPVLLCRTARAPTTRPGAAGAAEAARGGPAADRRHARSGASRRLRELVQRAVGQAPKMGDLPRRPAPPVRRSSLPHLARRAGRAIAGLSMGGVGTMSYAARHPETVRRRGQLLGRGGPDLRGTRSVRRRRRRRTACRDARGRAGAPATRSTWPATCAARDWQCAPGTASPVARSAVALDRSSWSCHAMSTAAAPATGAARITHVWDDYGPGATLALLAPRVAHDPGRRSCAAVPAPGRAGVGELPRDRPRFTAWGWRVAIDRAALEFAELRRARRRDRVASGSAKVTTARLYRPVPGEPRSDRLAADDPDKLYERRALPTELRPAG